MNRVRLSYIISICLATILVISCSPNISRSLLGFLFDGVPSAGNDSLNVSGDLPDSAMAEPLPSMSGDSLRDSLYYHYPYSENYCTSCHDENSKSEMIMSEPDLCYSCHEDYDNVYNVVHGPAAGGYCTSCHHPHMSAERKLLLRKGTALCLYCHDKRMVAKNPAHDEVANINCTDCHNPHGGKDRSMIR